MLSEKIQIIFEINVLSEFETNHFHFVLVQTSCRALQQFFDLKYLGLNHFLQGQHGA